MKKNLVLVLATLFMIAVTSSLFWSCGGTQKNKNMTEELKDFIKKFEDRYIPLYKQATVADWNATITGKEEDYKKSADLQFEMTKILSDKDDYTILKKIKESDSITDPILKRELIVLYDAYTGNQIDTAKSRKLIDLQSKITRQFNTYRVVVNGDTLTDNKVEDTLRNSTDSKYLEQVWKESKKIGASVAEEVKTLVKLRNEAAKDLGYKNYHQMSLSLSQEDPDQIEKLFDQLDSLTRDEFAKLKGEVDDYYVKRYKVKKDELMPWHYQNRFFQEAPKIYPVDVDAYYKGKDIVKITADYYKSIGFDIEDLIKKSDLFERPGKEQHAYCTDIDKEGDVRVLGNVVDNSKWMNTMLHEFGHASYTKYTDRSLPFILRDAAHIFTTEAIAEMFGRLATNPEWMKVMLGLKDEEAKKISDNCYKSLRLEQLTFSRWVQVMYRFEKSMYENPDQDLNKLWWDLVEKYQMLKRPVNRNEPDWASKIHMATVPCYYHNYLMGELLGSQFTYYLAKNIYKTDDIKTMSWCNNPEIGKYFIENVFKPGMKYEWNDMIEKATGEKLTAKYYAKQFCN
jgi:peptidyl-dipeptidase A